MFSFHFSAASADPLIADPEVCDGINLEDTCGFLILMSYGLYQSLKDATDSEHVNKDIASMVASSFNEQATLNGVAQAVVDKVVRIHHDRYMTCSDDKKNLLQTRKDITLLVRNFNYPLPNAANSPTATTPPIGVGTGSTAPLPSAYTLDQPLSVIIPNKSPPAVNRALFFAPNNPSADTNSSTYRSVTYTTSTYSSNDSTQSGEGTRLFSQRVRHTNPLQLDSDGKVESYVDFTDFFQKIDALTNEEREKFDTETELKPAYEPIMEEPSSPDETFEGPPLVTASDA